MFNLSFLRAEEADMKAILSNQKGNIDHRDISLHEYFVHPRQKTHARS